MFKVMPWTKECVTIKEKLVQWLNVFEYIDCCCGSGTLDCIRSKGRTRPYPGCV